MMFGGCQGEKGLVSAGPTLLQQRSNMKLRMHKQFATEIKSQIDMFECY